MRFTALFDSINIDFENVVHIAKKLFLKIKTIFVLNNYGSPTTFFEEKLYSILKHIKVILCRVPVIKSELIFSLNNFEVVDTFIKSLIFFYVQLINRFLISK